MTMHRVKFTLVDGALVTCVRRAQDCKPEVQPAGEMEIGVRGAQGISILPPADIQSAALCFEYRDPWGNVLGRFAFASMSQFFQAIEAFGVPGDQ